MKNLRTPHAQRESGSSPTTNDAPRGRPWHPYLPRLSVRQRPVADTTDGDDEALQAAHESADIDEPTENDAAASSRANPMRCSAAPQAGEDAGAA